MKHLEKVREALEMIMQCAPKSEDFGIGGKYDYDSDCGNVDDVANKAAAEEHFGHAQRAHAALSALQAHEEEVRELVEAAKLARIALFVATTPLPEDREAVRTAQAKVAAALRPFTEDEK